MILSSVGSKQCGISEVCCVSVKLVTVKVTSVSILAEEYGGRKEGLVSCTYILSMLQPS